MLTLKRILLLATTSALLAGCAVGPPNDTNPRNTLYRCDRNGTQEERQAC